MKTLSKKTLAVLLMLVITMTAVSYSTAVPQLSDENHLSSQTVSATLVSFDNNDITSASTAQLYLKDDVNDDSVVNARDLLLLRKGLAELEELDNASVLRADADCDGTLNLIDVFSIKKHLAGVADSGSEPVSAKSSRVRWSNTYKAARITASADDFSFRVDLSDYKYASESIGYCVIDCTIPDSQVYTVTVTPVFNGCQSGCKAYISQAANLKNGATLIQIPEALERNLTGLMLNFTSTGASGKTIYISGVYICADRYSADYIADNCISEPQSVTPQTLTVELDDEDVAIRLLNMTSDDRTNTNGGMFHHFKDAKWPSIAVDENDKLYVVASGARMAHVDPFGETIMATSSDAGESWSKPSLISNTVMDDRDAGILYLGSGKMLVSYFTFEGAAYLPGGESYSSLKPYAQGGSAPEWAAEWDSSYNPVGGIIGDYLDILDYAVNTDTAYDTSAASYVIKGSGYGTQWDVDRLELTGSGVTENMLNDNESFTYSRPAIKVPVTSCHGPILLSDGTILYAGKVMSGSDAPMDSTAVYTSKDEGSTWNYLSEIPLPYGYERNNFHELSVTETSAGTLLCAMRAQPSDNVNITPELTVYTCFSYDRGMTWTTPQPTEMTGAPPHLVTMDNGDIVMTYGYRTNPRCIYASVSIDDGRTWSNKEQVSGSFINNDDMGYPASAVLSDGTICTVYYGTYHKIAAGGEGYSSILCSQWTYSFD